MIVLACPWQTWLVDQFVGVSWNSWIINTPTTTTTAYKETTRTQPATDTPPSPTDSI